MLVVHHIVKTQRKMNENSDCSARTTKWQCYAEFRRSQRLLFLVTSCLFFKAQIICTFSSKVRAYDQTHTTMNIHLHTCTRSDLPVPCRLTTSVLRGLSPQNQLWGLPFTEAESMIFTTPSTHGILFEISRSRIRPIS